MRKNARARILSKSYNIFFRFFFCLEEEHETARITEKQKATKYTHNIHKHIIREGRVAGGALLVLEESK